jgi:hypothetical protein
MIRQWLASHKSLVATATSGSVIVALVTTVAIVSGGYTAQQMNLGDAAVWVTSQTRQLLGRANTEILQLNSVVPSAGPALDVVQSGSNVIMVDLGNNTVGVVDPATGEAGKSVPLPARRPSVQLAGDRVAISSAVTGQVWLMPFAQLPTFDASSGPTIDLGGRAVTSLAPDGTLFTFLPDTGVVHRIDATTGGGVSTSVTVGATGKGTNDSMTSIAGQWALLDPDAKMLYLPSGAVDLSSELAGAANPVLEQPSTTGDTVYIASSTGLIGVPIAGGTPRRILTENLGRAAAPALVHGCVYAAWAGGTTWSTCGGASAGHRGTLAGVPSGAELALRANGERVVANDVKSGATWAVQRGNASINNWDELVTKKTNLQQVALNKQDTPPQYEKSQLPPVAVDDQFGARPGRVTTLPVLLNDYDPNGDVLVVDSFEGIPASAGRVDLVNNNQQLQITLPDSASGTVSFSYTITDGHGGSATAKVTVTVRLPTENSPPVQARATKAIVQAGGRVTTQVLGDWYDPDGDPFYLASATVATPDAVSFTPQGAVAYSDKGAGGTLKDVALVVSDSRAQGTGSLAVTVQPPGSVPIITEPFVVLAYQGHEVTVTPLTHARGGTGTLRLGNVPAKPDATISADYQGGSFRFLSDQVGTHNIDYAVTDGTLTTTGTVRIDVQAPPEAKTQPIAVPHTAFIREQTTQQVDVLATDVDPSGGVLLITGVTQPPASSGIRVEILGQRVLRVTLNRPLDAPVDFHYRISNGLAETEGTVTVVQLPALTVHQPPVANPDTISVRVGDTTDIPVLANDQQPDGETLTLDPTLATPLPSGAGLLFASGDVLRYLAPSKPGNFTAVYRVTGADGQWATAAVTISVRELDAATNNPPVPTTVTARVLAGDTVRIPIPLTGVDPDGDSVQLLGQETNPSKGAVLAVGSDWMDYQAGEYSAGTDTFTYAVIDALGARAIGTVRVGIASRSDGARNPVAVEDDVTVRPGKSVSVQVLANDSDPDGSALSVTGVVPLDGNAKAVRKGSIVTVTAPAKEGVYSFLYTIQNARGGSSESFIRVAVSKDAPLARPITRDTVLGLSDILGKQTVDVNVLANVFFPDGPVSSLALSVLPGYSDRAQVTANKRVRVTIGATSQIIPFEVAHPGDPNISSFAFIRVPGYDDALPQLKRGVPRLTVTSESAVRIHLNDYVVAVGGKQVRLTDASTVRATHSNGANLVVNGDTLEFTSAARYFGTASIAFQVTDGTSATDPQGRVATIVLPITVTARANQPPVFTGALIDFEPGQQKTIDLVKLTSYPYAKDQSELTYTVQGEQPSGVSLSLSGQKLTIAVSEKTAKGAHPSISIGVKDAVNPGQAGRIDLNVVPSTRPVANPQPDVAIAPRGTTTVVDVLANDGATNPFPDVPLRVVAVRGLDNANLPAGVSITPNADNSKLSVTVAAGAAAADTNLQYEVVDATGDPDRNAWGTVRISVQDRPAPVTNVQIAGISDHALTLSWIPGSFNNSTITGFELTVTRADNGQIVGTTSCQTTTCTVQTPGNGPDNAVHIAVTARNALGVSDPVSYTDAAWSNIMPAAPAALNATPLDTGLRVTWTKPADAPGASPITSYLVNVGGISRSVTVPGSDAVGTPYSVNLTDASIGNGGSVPFSVASRNDFYGGRTLWNQVRGTGIPSGPPIASASAPSAVPDLDSGQSATLSWPGIFTDNGKSITSYYAAVYQGGSAPSCAVTGVENGNPTLSVDSQNSHFIKVSGGTTSVTFTGLSANTNYNFLVYAYNGQGCTASAVATATPRSRPDPPAGFAASVPGGSSDTGYFDAVLTSMTPPANPGGAALSYEYQFVGAFTTAPLPVPAGGVLAGGSQSYGQAASVQLRTVATYPGGVVLRSDWSSAKSPGVPVSTVLSGARFGPSPADATTGQFSWTGWPTGTYSAVKYSCDGGVTQRDMPAPGQTGTCTLATGQLSGTLTVTVIANGGTLYTHDYRSSDLG